MTNTWSYHTSASLFCLAFAALCSGCSTAGENAEAPPAGWQAYGESITLEERTPIADILSHPDDFAGRTVAVEGRVTEVCAMMGCWIEVQDEDSHRLRLKVEDGAIVFPQQAVGQRAVLEGKVEKLTYSREDYVTKARHEAEERGVPFDPDSVQPPYEEIRLWGSGALIEAAAETS